VQGNFYKVLSADFFFFFFFKVSFFTEGKGRTYQRSVPLFEGLGTRALREDAVPYSPSSIVPKNKGTMSFPYTYTYT
jgi:hypothetical protein